MRLARLVGPALLCTALLAPAPARARCDGWVPSAVVIESILVGGLGVGLAAASSGIVAAANESRQYSFGYAFLISGVGAGVGIPAFASTVELASSCAPTAAGFSMLWYPLLSLPAAVIMPIVLWAVAPHKPRTPPVSFGVVPVEGGGLAVVGWRF